MSDHFLDTSALVKHYHFEIGTPKVDSLWNSPTTRLFVSRLGVVETVSTLALDAIQLAVARDSIRQGVSAELVTADHVLLTVAPLEGMAVNNPEAP